MREVDLPRLESESCFRAAADFSFRCCIRVVAGLVPAIYVSK
jgi:hypothetical protein